MMPVPSLHSHDDLQPEVRQALQHFRLIVHSLKLHFQDLQATTGLGGSQLGCLAAVKASPGMRMSELARTLGVRQATASNLADVLERRGLLERRRDTRDQRVVQLHLTPLGLAKVEALPEPAAGLLPEALARLEPAALEHLNGLLGNLVGLMQNDGAEGTRPLAGG